MTPSIIKNGSTMIGDNGSNSVDGFIYKKILQLVGILNYQTYNVENHYEFLNFQTYNSENHIYTEVQ